MKILDSCKDWTMIYDNATLPAMDENTQEFKILKSVLHLAGDLISAYNNLPKDLSPELKEAVLAEIAVIFTDTKNQIVSDFDHAMSLHTFTVPLDKGYSEEEIFGIKLKESMEALLTSETDTIIAAEHFHAISKPGVEDEDDDGLN